ncbi:TonB-dependent receptor [Solitalea lacus]|uniref:TonB-dependent receptor n=1 Tax=Solitalea lacus TaxID=2911172 RepID=UPI001EDB48D5|nr:TonB-dependent receptor [Solitalea lacus]UKJ09271.1 TonB-dependent receptor [Solitalea lacus]
MKQKVYYFLALACLTCLIHQNGYAQNKGAKQTISNVADTAVARKVTITVKDLATSKLIDSVRVTLGGQANYTINGIVTFENSNDSTVLVFKPGYYRIMKKLTSSMMTVNLIKSDGESNGLVVHAGLNKNSSTSLGGSEITITGNELRRINSINFIDGLKYYVPSLIVSKNNYNGSNPNALPEIKLLGTNSFPYSATAANNNNSVAGVQTNPSAGDFIANNVTSTGAPIILLDGIQVSLQTALDIDLNRIQKVTVLKDAVATASYGMRGGNGVIAIQTEKPKGGDLNVSFTEQLQVATPDVSSFNSLSAKDKFLLEYNAGLYNGKLAIYKKRINQLNNNVNTDWLNLPLQNGVGLKHSLALSSGNDDIVYGLTASYNDIQGSMKGSSRKNLDLGAHFGGRFGSFSFNNQFNYLGTNAVNSPYGSLSEYAKMNSYWSPYDAVSGKIQKFVENDTINEAGAVKYLNYTNPAYNAMLSTTDAAKYARYSNITNLNWVLGGGFQLNGLASISKQNDEINYFLPPNHTAFANITLDKIFERGLYKYTSNSFTDLQGGASLRYQNDFGRNEIFVNLGENIIQTSSESEGVMVRGFATDRLSDIAFGNAYSSSKPASGKVVTRYASTFGNLTYSYDKRYQIDLSGSFDYHSSLSNPAKFAAAGLAWNVHNEKFLKSAKWIDLLRIKGSLGITGNQYFLSYLNHTTYNYYTDQQYVPAGSTIGMGLGAYITGVANKNLQAPETYKQDIGVDAAFFNNRLALSLNAYKQRSYRMVLPISSVSSTGYQNFSFYDNYGELENGGFEISAAATVYKSLQNNLSWNVMANTLHATDKLTTNSGPFFDNLNYNNNYNTPQNALQSQYVLGKSPYAIWAVPSLGIDPKTGKEVFVKKDGSTTTTWDANDKVYAGKLTPSWSGSLGTDLTYKQFALGAYFNYQLGAKVYNQTIADIENGNIENNVDGRVTTLSKPIVLNGLLTAPTFATTRLVEDDDKIQCSSIMLGYTMPKTIAEKIKAKNLGIKLMMNNAFEIGGADMQRGVYYPFQRNYTFTLNANF